MAVESSALECITPPAVGNHSNKLDPSAEGITGPIIGIESSFSNVSIHEDAVPECEPFPDYYESCRYFDESDGRIDLVDKQQEEAYNSAIAKVVEEVIRFRDIDASIISLPMYIGNTPSGAWNEHRPTSPETSNGESEKHWEDDARTDPGTTIEELGNENLPRILDELHQLLSDPELKPKIRERFTAMANMILSMNVLLFYAPAAPNEVKLFLAGNDAVAARQLSVEIVRYLAKVDQRLQEQIDAANHVAYMLSVLARDTSASPYVTFCRMAQVVINHLRKPRPLEQRLLSLFLEFYDTYIYNTFLNIRNRQTIAKDELNTEKLELSRALIAVWDTLNRVIENYEAYVVAMRDMKRQYIGPAMESLANTPEVWQGSQGPMGQPRRESQTESLPIAGPSATVIVAAADMKELKKGYPKGFI